MPLRLSPGQHSYPGEEAEEYERAGDPNLGRQREIHVVGWFEIELCVGIAPVVGDIHVLRLVSRGVVHPHAENRVVEDHPECCFVLIEAHHGCRVSLRTVNCS